ncbi:MAG: dihydrolipoyllysine-residue succinyltransferase [Roseibacillus sp.]|jgi:2-oxoglutarate dehydrogenase E2 component (dihydrolipoamide succinyltransferase)
MAHEVKIPAAGESINSASVGQWHKADGDAVQKGELLATIETDKVSTELEAEIAGTLKIVVPEGEEVAIGTLIAQIDEQAVAPADPPEPEPAAQAPDAESSPAAVSADGPGEPEVIEIKVPAAGESITSASIAQWHKRDGEVVAEGDTLVTLETDKVSAELDAEADGVLNILSAEGAEVVIGAVIGTLTVGEAPAPATEERAPVPIPDPAPPVETASPVPATAPAQAPARPSPAIGAAPEVATKLRPDLAVVPEHPRRETIEPVFDGRTTRKRLSSLRRKIAAQLVNAQHTAAILTTFNEVDMSALLQLRKTVQESFIEKYGVKLGFMSLFVKAAVHALKEVPSVNGRIDGDEVVQNHFYDVGIAVGTKKGLVVPVVREADQKSCAEIEQDIYDYATRARDGKIQLEDLQGGVFTISNGGIYGSLLSTPILNPPQSGILGMHTIQQRPVAIDGKVEVRPMMYLALSYDHRLVDGEEAVTFLIHIKECIESPASLLLQL